MALMIVDAKNVGPKERRWWATSFVDACDSVVNEGIRSADDLHTDPYVEDDTDLDGPPTHAIVDRAYPSGERPTNEHTPEATRGEAAWQEMVWRQAFNAALTTMDITTDRTEDIIKWCSETADAALEAWKKRWQR